ncbi:Presenilin-domain-containing protein [Phlyctochytrium arcticum]|nr:Presenilin-domain-containing protein [Phlyctochytrium arcticum]
MQRSATSNSTNLDPSSAARTRNSTTDQIVIPPRGTSMEQQEPPDLVPEELTEEEKMEDLKFYLEQIYLIIKPVLCCIALSILWVKLTTPFEPNFSTGLSQQSAPSTTVGGNFGVGPSGNGEAFVGALIILAQIVVATVVVVVLFYFNCMKVLFGFFTLVVTVLLAMFGWTLGVELLSVHNLTLDKITFVFFLWNLTVVGVLMIFYKGPLFLQQAYLVIMCSKMAFTLTKLPALTTWILLALLAVWDLIAVLCPFGPLRILVEASQNNQREIPALLYTVMVWMTMATPADPPPNRLKNTGVPAPPVRAYTSSSSRSRGSLKDPPSDYGEDRQLTDSSHNWTNNTVDAAGHGGDADEVEMHIRNSEGERGSTANLVDRYQHEGEAARRRPPPLGDGTATVSDVVLEDTAARTSIDELEEEEEAARGGLKLGLGDFVFYSVLVGRAALFDWVTTVTCVVGVLTGLNMTIFLLVLYQKALPALPISIAFGILFYFVSSVTLTPFVNALVQRPNKFTVPGVDSWLWVGRGEGSGAIFV